MSILYKARRIGKNGKPFLMYKFRTMRENADQIGGSSTADDDPRITKIGKFLRKTKLDEIPQAINLIKGDMAICGPRPEVKDVIDLMTQSEKNVILSIRPGIVDLASLWDFQEGKTLIGERNPHQAYLDKIWPKKKRLQIFYIKNKTLKLDFLIIIQVILKLCQIPVIILPKNIRKELEKE